MQEGATREQTAAGGVENQEHAEAEAKGGQEQRHQNQVNLHAYTRSTCISRHMSRHMSKHMFSTQREEAQRCQDQANHHERLQQAVVEEELQLIGAEEPLLEIEAANNGEAMRRAEAEKLVDGRENMGHGVTSLPPTITSLPRAITGVDSTTEITTTITTAMQMTAAATMTTERQRRPQAGRGITSEEGSKQKERFVFFDASRLREKRAVSAEALDDLQQQLSDVQQECLEKEAAHAELIETISRRLEAEEARSKALQAELEAAQSQSRVHAKEVRAREEISSALQLRLESCEREIEAARSRSNEMEQAHTNELSSLRSQLESAKAPTNSLDPSTAAPSSLQPSSMLWRGAPANK